MSKGQANPYPLRVPYEMMEKFKVVAADHGRSVNSEIVQLIRQAVEIYETDKGSIIVDDE